MHKTTNYDVNAMVEQSKNRSDQPKWNERAYRARIKNSDKRERFEAGSPNSEEIVTYSQAIPAEAQRKTAVILGMTPELRNMAAREFERIICVDHNQYAINLYRDWLADELRQKESIKCNGWLEIEHCLTHQADVIFGDGIFANLPDINTHIELLQKLKDALADNGALIVRKALIPRGFNTQADSFTNLLKRFRCDSLDEIEFGFAVRLLGHYASCYTPDTYILDNQKVFDECKKRFNSGIINDLEYESIMRFYFGGKNCLIPEDIWEKIASSCGFKVNCLSSSNRDWYRYYKVFVLQPM